MNYSQFIRWALANIDQVPTNIKHSKKVWTAIQSGDPSDAAREAGEFLIWLSAILETMPKPSGPEAAGFDLLAIEEAGISLADINGLWSLIQLLMPILLRGGP